MVTSGLTTSTFAAGLAYSVTLGALQFRADVYQRSAASRTGGLALLIALLTVCVVGVAVRIVRLLERHGIGPLF